MITNIGFIGLGIMGEPMARNLLKAGYELTVFNRTAAKAVGIKAAGAALASSPVAIGQAAEAVILMLTGPEAIENSLFAKNGLVREGTRCKTIINMSTVSPAYTRDLHDRLKKQNIVLLDAPVSGSKEPARNGSLVILASGPREVVEMFTPVLLKMGKKVIYCGAAGAASSMKMVVNLLVCTMISGLSEALTLGEGCGLSRETILETISAGPLGCGLFSMKADMLAAGEYPVQFPFKHMYKDLNFILETAGETGTKARIGETLKALYEEGMARGLAELDFAAVKEVIASESIG